MTISKEAIEAAARAMCDDGCNWDNNLPGHRKTMWLDRAEIALTAALPFLALRPAPSQICGACGEPWTGQTCAQKDNGWPHEVCFPVEAPSPAPSQSDEVAGEALARYIEAWWSDRDESAETPSQRATAALATVRAEATLAGAAAEREAACDEMWRVCALIGAKPGSSIHSAFKHADEAIRARK